mmetsp:Transcript_12385/g.37329  ORF Transcript_12385/g.37329 Transcript_12385/m.37329 type:complete len:403 (-) Transcript_12385:229-1437(-)
MELILVAVTAHGVVRKLIADQRAAVLAELVRAWQGQVLLASADRRLRQLHQRLRHCSATGEEHLPLTSRADHGDEVNLVVPQVVERPPGVLRPALAAAQDLAARVGASDAEGRHAAVAAVLTPGCELRCEVDGVTLHGQMRIQDLQVLVWRRCRSEDHHDALCETGHAGRSLQVGHVTFRTCLQDGALTLGEDILQGANLDGVPQCGTRAVALRRGHLHRHQARHPHGVLAERCLRGPVGCCQARAPPVLVHRAADHAPEAVRVLDLVAVHLDEGGAATLAALVSIRAHVKGEAPPLERCPAHGALAHEGDGPHQCVDANDERPLVHTAPCGKASLVVPLICHVVMRNVERDKRGRARGGDRASGANQVEEVRQSCAGDARADADALLREVALDHVGPGRVR